MKLTTLLANFWRLATLDAMFPKIGCVEVPLSENVLHGHGQYNGARTLWMQVLPSTNTDPDLDRWLNAFDVGGILEEA